MVSFIHWFALANAFLSLNFIQTQPDCQNSSSTRKLYERFGASQKRASTLGLNPSSLNVNGIAVGFVPASGEPIQPSTAADINEIIGAPISVVGTYIELTAKDPNLGHLEYDLKQIKLLKGNPVWEIALMPVEGLEKVTPEVAANVGKRMAFVNSFGVNVWLRFAHEMNGDWYAWGEKPQLFLQKWKLITDEVRKQAPGTYMLWAPNSAFGENHDSIHGGYNPYWPGGDMVDMIGLSFYHYGGFYRKNILPGPSEAFDTIKTFASLFGTKSHDRPMVLAETSAAYTHSLKTGEPAPGGASEKSIKLDWLKQLVSPKLSAEVPELKAFVWFEILKNENASGVSKVKSEDFRLVSGPDKSLKDEALAILKGTKINKAKHYSGKKKGKKNSRQRGCRRCKKKFFRPIKNLKHPH